MKTYNAVWRIFIKRFKVADWWGSLTQHCSVWDGNDGSWINRQRYV